MNLLKRILSYSPYLLILFVVVPVFAGASGLGEAIDGGIKKVLWTFVNNVFGSLIGIAGIMLDTSVKLYVVGFGETWGVNSTGVGGAIDDSWKLVRDLFNITFIFGLVWLGFKMILRSDDSNTRRTLITLILAALLVNFSLFITKFVVDFTNILASQIADAFSGKNPGDINSISSSFMQLFGLSSIWDLDPFNNDLNSDSITSDTSYMYIFGTALVFLIGAFTFAAGAIMLMIRFAALCIYMVFSPLMFLGMVFPGLRSVSSKYWSGFLGRAFYAPAYLMLIYLAAFVMGSYNSTAGSLNQGSNKLGFSAGALNGVAGDVAGSFAPFALVCVFLIASVVVAGKMSADGASTAMKLGKNLSGRSQRFVKRNTIGLGAYGVSAAGRGAGRAVDRFDEASNRNWGRKIARGGLNTITLGATSHRSLKGATGAMEKASVAGSRTREQYLKDEKERKIVRDRITTRNNDEAALEAAKDININTTDETEKKLLDEAEKAANRFSSTELEEMGEKKRNDVIARYLKASTVSKLLDSDKLSADEKKNLGKAYEEAVKKQITDSNTGEVISEKLAQLSGKQLEVLGDEFVRQYADQFTEGQMDDLKKSDTFTERQKDSHKAIRKEIRKTKAASDTQRAGLFRETEVMSDGSVGLKGTPRKASELASLPYEAFVQDGALTKEGKQAMSADVMKQIARNANQGKPTMSADDRQMLALTVLGTPGIDNHTATYLKSHKGLEDYFLTEEKANDAQATSEWGDSEM